MLRSKYLKRVLPIMNRDSLDSITSKTKEITVSGENGEQEVVEVPVWNGTVANILLMSLGPRSAPEILLSIVGIVGNEFKQDALGPSLIGWSQQNLARCALLWIAVGSGAFNLLIISAISVVVIPRGESRRIETFSIFGVTMFFSIAAYLWLIVILVLVSPNKVK